MKRLLSAVLVLVMVLTLIPLGAVTASAETLSGTTGDCTWTLVDGVLTISGEGKIGDYDRDGEEGPHAPWYYYRDVMKEVIIENGVTEIGEAAFAFLKIYYINIPTSVELIAADAFYDSELTAIAIPYSVKTIRSGAFAQCSKLDDVYYSGNHIDRQNMEIEQDIAVPIKYMAINEANWHYTAYETLIKTAEDTWCYYVGGVKRDHTTLVKYKNKWFYVENGVWNITATTLVEYKGKMFHVVDGKWTASTNTLVNYNGEWYGVIKGKVEPTKKTLIKYNGKWFYIENGKWKKDKLIFKYNGKRFYIEDGKVQFNYSGKVKVNGMYYNIKNGKVV